jgi:protocatechuate 3,4-dioxygenase, alpha subunit
MSELTTSQTIGPFFHGGLKWAFADSAVGITISGRVFDGNGAEVTDAMVEAWRADVALDDLGFVRVATDSEGRFSFAMPSLPTDTDEPLAYVCLFARGLLNHHFSAVFVEGHVDSSLLNQVPATRRATLTAKKIDSAHYEWDIHLQGERETVFFEYQS